MSDKMRILILEDSPARIRTFKKKLATHDVYYFDNVKDAKDAVDLMEPFDVFFLDHDLDNRIFVDSKEDNTGYQFAKYLAEKGIKAQFIIHSMNPGGAKNMAAQLPLAQVVPFINLF